MTIHQLRKVEELKKLGYRIVGKRKTGTILQPQTCKDNDSLKLIVNGKGKVALLDE